MATWIRSSDIKQLFLYVGVCRCECTCKLLVLGGLFLTSNSYFFMASWFAPSEKSRLRVQFKLQSPVLKINLSVVCEMSREVL